VDTDGSGTTPDALRTLACVLDEIIPPDGGGRLPGAGELGLARRVAAIPELTEVVAEGIAGLDERAHARGAAGFAELAADERREVLNELAAAQPAFLPGLIFQTYVGYYQEPRVLEGLGLEPRAPHPLGYELEQSDLDSLLAGVRGRRGLYRE
jgi:hypothetical protein